MVEVTEYIDVAQILLYIFWIFFAGLVIHLQMESRREGFPIESDTGEREPASFIFTPEPKTWHLPHGHGTLSVPNDDRDVNSDNFNATRINDFEGTAWEPNSEDPMGEPVGPGAWTERANVPDMTFEGHVKIVPMRNEKEYVIAKGDIDPRGLRVVGCDAIVGGEVVDIWVDKAEQYIRYLEVKTDHETPKNVLLPFNFCVIKTIRGNEKVVYVHAITGAQFHDVPTTRKRAEVTLREEDRIMGFYGGGLLYATPDRTKPALF
ncbi:MAG: photosynthetic reaction center subunit H [Pseudomonadota bacterium]